MLSRHQGETDRYRARDMRHTGSHNNCHEQTKTSPPHNLETPRPLAMEADTGTKNLFFYLYFQKLMEILVCQWMGHSDIIRTS